VAPLHRGALRPSAPRERHVPAGTHAAAARPRKPRRLAPAAPAQPLRCAALTPHARRRLRAAGPHRGRGGQPRQAAAPAAAAALWPRRSHRLCCGFRRCAGARRLPGGALRRMPRQHVQHAACVLR
jgi:hypothetical protein